MEKQNCPVCAREMKEWGDVNLKHNLHLIVTKNMIDGETHTHGDLENKEAMKELIATAEGEIGIAPSNKPDIGRKEVVFKNRQRIGDMLMFTCGVRDFKAAFPDVRVNVVSTAGHIFDFNPYIDRTLVPTPENTVEVGPGKLTNRSNSLDWHFANAFRVCMEEKLNVQIQQGESRPDIWLTQEEWEAPRVIEGPYWIISTTGEKGWGCKMYPTHKWQEVIDQNPDITFVQIGTAEDNAPRLKGANVVDYVGKTQSRDNGIRDLFKLFLNAEGSIGLVSFHMHLSGALYKPCVVIAGGREPVSFTRYPGHAYLSNDGMLPCAIKACWHCSIDKCSNIVVREDTIEKKIPKCADIIESEDVTRAIRGYYKGGRLTIGKVSERYRDLKKKVVPTPPKVAPTVAEPDKNINTYGMTFGGGSLTDKDWAFIAGAIKKYNVQTCLEFGAGLSTLLFYDSGVKTVTYETKQGWIDKIKHMNPRCKIQLWDGLNLDFAHRPTVCFDMVFVDGPAGDMAREQSTALSALMGNVVIVHDAGREWARKYQDAYLKPYFEGPIKGGHRCHMWVRKSVDRPIVEAAPQAEDIQSAEPSSAAPCKVPSPAGRLKIDSNGNCEVVAPRQSKSIKIVSTAKGWGGCARSVTTIMKFLVDAGHRVQFIPFRNSVGSREYKEMLAGDLKGVDVALGYSAIKEACDVMLVYADDFVWEFKTPEVAEIFSEVNAEKKIMMLNYRRGEVGKTPWTQGWDQYLFLCAMQEQELLKVYPAAQGKTKVLPPCTILEPFLAVEPDYGNGIRIRRHNSQGDAKFMNANYTEEQCVREIENMLSYRDDLSISMMPGPTFYKPGNIKFVKAHKTPDPKGIAEFLATGNLFWYSLPTGYTDMGPRVILEAMAVGLPVMADSWSGGAVDRVTPECGHISGNKEWFSFVKGLTAESLARMGKASKERAYNEFRPEKWMEVLLS